MLFRRNRTPPKNINGKMPSVANSPSSEPLTDGMAGLTLENVRYPIGSRITARLVNGTEMKGEVVAFDPNFKVVILSEFHFNTVLGLFLLSFGDDLEALNFYMLTLFFMGSSELTQSYFCNDIRN